MALLQNLACRRIYAFGLVGAACRHEQPEAARYRTTNWKSYNEGLRRRGSLLIWLDKDMVWLANKAGRRGRPPMFSEARSRSA
jgi:hypothetical protein